MKRHRPRKSPKRPRTGGRWSIPRSPRCGTGCAPSRSDGTRPSRLGLALLSTGAGGGWGGGLTIQHLTLHQTVANNGLSFEEAGQRTADSFLDALRRATNDGTILPPAYPEAAARRIIARYDEIAGMVEEALGAEQEARSALGRAQREHDRARVLGEWARIDAAAASATIRQHADRREALFARVLAPEPESPIAAGLPQRLRDLFGARPPRFTDAPTDAA
jgi:hypothetical protein